MRDYLSNLKEAVEKKNLGDAKTLLSLLPLRPTPEKEAALLILSLMPDKAAFDLLSYLSGQTGKHPALDERIMQLIIDRAHLSFSFARILYQTADPMTLNHVAPLLKHILSKETDRGLLAETLNAAGKAGIKLLTDDIAEFIYYDDPELKKTSVTALERIGTPQALSRLKQAADTEKCDADILSAVKALEIKILDPKHRTNDAKNATADIKHLLESLADPDIPKRFSAFLTLAEKGKHLTSALADALKTENHDILINLLRLISRTIPVEAVNLLFALVQDKTKDPAIRFAAYTALEAYPELESAASLLSGLSDSVSHVRLAAVRALDKHLSDLICAEIKTRIESGTKKGELLAQTVLDAGAKRLIEHLMISDTFSYIASNYLAKSSPIQALDTFIDILEQRRLRSTARKYTHLRTERMEDERPCIVVVSSFDAVLTTYTKLIYNCGFSSLAFQTPQDAFETIVSDKPDAIVCDLFLNDMTGIDFAGECRELYAPEDLPIIISTLQKGVEPDRMKNDLQSAGITGICRFPASSAQIKSWMAPGKKTSS